MIRQSRRLQGCATRGGSRAATARLLAVCMAALAAASCSSESKTPPMVSETSGTSATSGGVGAGGSEALATAATNGTDGASSEIGTTSGASAGTSASTAGSSTSGAGGNSGGTASVETTASVGGAGGSAGASSSLGGIGGTGDAGSGGVGGQQNAIVLFDGTSFDAWRPLDGNGDVAWELPGDGTMVVVPNTGNIVTRETFEDVLVHVEYKTPMLPDDVTGQSRGNSGVYLNSMYELQVLDSFGLPPLLDGCGAVYNVSAPTSTACFAQEVWNTYEIEFQTARFDDQNQKLSNARIVSAQLNGVLVQENVDVPDSTEAGQPEAPGPGPLMLQDHQNRVAFRNIWVLPR